MGIKSDRFFVGCVVATIILLMLLREASAEITVVDLRGDFIGMSSNAVAVNEVGQIVGEIETPYGTHAFMWKNGQMTDLGTIGGFSA